MSFSRLETKDDFAGNTGKVSKESNLSADSSGSLVWLRTLAHNTSIGAAYYHVNNWGSYTDSQGMQFSRLDLNINHSLVLPHSYQIKLQAALQYRLDDDALLYGNNNYSDDLHAYASMELNF